MKIAIIGGSGFIGTRLASRLVKSGYSIKIIDKVKSESHSNLWQYGDVTKIETLLDPLRGYDIIYNLAAEHSDNVSPVELYNEVNVNGARNVCKAASLLGIQRIIFTSSVAVYGSSEIEKDETAELNPENPYGSSKRLAEEIYRTWNYDSFESALVVVRPTVVFGECNRGNVYNLLKQVASGRFLMIGSGKNRKSMVYVENIAAFLEYLLIYNNGEHLFNYVDKPDFDMNTLIGELNRKLGKKNPSNLRIPHVLGLLGGYFFDFISLLIGKKLPISSIRVKKFAQNTCFTSNKLKDLYFEAPVSLEEGLDRTIEYEFLK